MTQPVYYKSAVELSGLLKERKLTSKSLVTQSFDRIRSIEPQLNAFLTLQENQALETAERVDALYDKGEDLPPLAGIPVALKDNICVRGVKTTCGSQILKNFTAPYNAGVVDRMNANHMIILGKTNMDEFAMGSSTENSSYFVTKNPWNTEYVPGGSSGGSACAVSSGESVLSLGSDTGGSIRQPAGLCGVVGFKPTYGRVSRYGLVAFASSLDQIGPFSRTVEDSAYMLNVICGNDPSDSTSAPIQTPDFTKALKPNVKGLKIGVPSELFGENIDPEVKQALVAALDQFKKQGAQWEEVQMRSFPHALSTYYIIAPAEASANLARFDGVRYGFRAENPDNLKDMYKKTRGQGFGPEVKRRILLGTYVLSSGYYDAYYIKAQKMRTLVNKDFEKAFSNYDVLISPTSPTPAFKIGQNMNDPLQMYLADIATIPVNLAGLPGVSVPCGFSNGLPIGMQIIGKAFDEETILRAAFTYQSVTDYHKKSPELGI
ncbi:Asp-tRNA(Asn)/Glu-tRNA(Gln) amidotransferase subunit GatA [Thermoproteota archaeon]